AAPPQPHAARARRRAGPPAPSGGRDPHVPPGAGGRRPVIQVVVDDLAFLPSDAVVRPVTSRLDATTPAVRRLETVGGPAFVDRLHVHKELGIGSAVVTGGGDLPGELVIHAVRRPEPQPRSTEAVRLAWTSA